MGGPPSQGAAAAAANASPLHKAPQRKQNEALSNKDFSCTTWLPSLEDALAAGQVTAAAPPPDPATLGPGMVKAVNYSSTAMGVKVGGMGAHSFAVRDRGTLGCVVQVHECARAVGVDRGAGGAASGARTCGQLVICSKECLPSRTVVN